MPYTPIYEELPVPASLKGSIRRIMRCEVTIAEDITIPARPTGYAYIGWLAKGRATASANGDTFSLDEGQTHISGQLTSFDATYCLHGSCVQFLAECTPVGLYQLLQQDIGALCNKVRVFSAPAQTLSEDKKTFVAFLEALQADAGPANSKIAQSAERIEATNGNILVSDLTAEFEMSDRQFHRQFTKIVGLPPRSFISIRRIMYALRLMAEDPSQSIADIATAAQFYDQSHLTRAFTQYLRSTPARLAFDHDGVLKSIVART